MSIKETAKNIAKDLEEGTKSVGKSLESFFIDARDSGKEFFQKEETQNKFTDIENSVRSTRDNIKEKFKEESKRQEENKIIDKLQDSCFGKLKDLSSEEFEDRSKQFSDSLKAIKEASTDSKIEITGDCTVKVTGEDGGEL